MASTNFTSATESDQSVPYKDCSKGTQCIHPDGPHLPLTEFHNNSSSKDGHTSLCKPCACAKSRKWGQDNSEYASQRAVEYYLEHSEEIKARVAADYLANREVKIEQVRERYYGPKHDEILARERERIQNNPELRAKRDDRSRMWVLSKPDRRKAIANRYAKSEKGRIAHLRRKARKESLPDTLTLNEWFECLEYWNYSCVYCGAGNKLHADHFVALADPNCPGTIALNIVPACKSCNCSKQHREVVTWLSKRVSEQELHEILSRIGAYFDLVEYLSIKEN